MRSGFASGTRRGSAVVEVSLMMPWIVFLFVGIFDFGFYSYAAIATQNAARAAAVRISTDQFSFAVANACVAALGELRGMPNMANVTTCAASAGAVSDSQPAAVEAVQLNESTSPACADCTLPPSANGRSSVQVRVTYRTAQLIPIPGAMMGRMTLTRVAESRVLVR